VEIERDAQRATRPSRSIDRIADALEDVATDVEMVVFHRCIVAALVDARA
jgi:hypothetical protein